MAQFILENSEYQITENESTYTYDYLVDEQSDDAILDTEPQSEDAFLFI